MRTTRRIATTFLLLTGLVGLFQVRVVSAASPGRIVGIPTRGAAGVAESISSIMQRQALVPIKDLEETDQEKEVVQPDRTHLPQNPLSPDQASSPALPLGLLPIRAGEGPYTPQTVGVNFTGATLSGVNPTFSFPPDCQGAVGPTQYVMFVNGRLVTFSKATGVADGVLNADPDVFFFSVRNNSRTSDPRIRYDRLTGRWILVIINVSTPNRILIAVSNAASAGVISGSTVFTYFFINIATTPPAISSTCLADYPTLGVDANALYIGTNNFCNSPQTYVNSDGYVIRKSSILGVGPIVVTAFRNLNSGAPNYIGPYTPQGVDNFDPASNEGYFIGVDGNSYGLLQMIRVATPGATPTASATIPITVATTGAPINVPHLGNTGGTNGRLSALDDRLFAAHIRNGRLWTSHSIQVSNTGVYSASGGRDGSRWYEFNVPVGSGTPTIVESGTVFDPAVTNPRSYWIPSVMVSGQGHAAFTLCSAGNNDRANAGTVGRLSGDALGTVQSVALYSSSSSAYNPTSDPGGSNGRRWGDYTYTSLDPIDDQTMWAVSMFCDVTNSYGVRIAKLIAPPPATPSALADITAGQASVPDTLTGVVVTGSGFWDPGTNLPGVPVFNHLAAAITNGGATGTPPTVVSATWISPTKVALVLNASAATANIAAEKYTISITNPDGQVVGAAVVHVVAGGPSVSLSAGPTAAEGNAGTTNFNFTVNVAPVSGSPVTVRYQTTDGTATAADADYQAATDSIVIPASTATGTITVKVNGDLKFETSETFGVQLTSVTGASLGAPATATGTITNDDAQPTVSIAPVTSNEGNAGTTPFNFAVTLSNPSYLAVSMTATTSDGSATIADNDYTAASGPVSIAAGLTSANFAVSVKGDTKFELNDAFTVTLSSPVNATLGTGVAAGTITNDDTLPAVSINSVTLAEGNSGSTVFSFTVTLSNASYQAVNVTAATGDGSATVADTDYTAAGGLVSIPAGSTSAPFPVSVQGDTKFESNETFSVTLSAPVNSTLGAATGTGTITNDDGAPTMSIDNVSLAEGNAGTTAFNFTVSLSAPSGVAVSAAYNTADGSATLADNDYQVASGNVSFTPGVTSQPVSVLVNGDLVTEANETFTVALSSLVGALPGVVSGTGTIQNDDNAPSLSIGNVSHAEGNAGTTVYVFPVTLSNPSASPVAVNFQTADSTATIANSDYVAANGVVNFPAGVTAESLLVSVNGDLCGEPDEYFSVDLSGASGASIAVARGTGTIVNDDDVTLPLVTVTAPNGGESVTVGSLVAITWTASDDVGVVSVDLCLSRDGGASYPEVLASGLANSGTFNWTVTGPPTTAAFIKVKAHDAGCNTGVDSSDASFTISGSAVAVDGLGAVKEFALTSIRPNPTSGAARIDYQLPRSSRVRLVVVDLQGRVVATLADGPMSAGRYHATWMGRSERGSAPTGIYFVRFEAGGKSFTKRMVLVR